MPSAYERALARLVPDVLAETVRICEIPAPTFHERRRARYVYSQLEAIGGWDQLAIDGIANVVAIRRGRAEAARVLVSAHLDTVLPDAETPVTRTRGRLNGRGVGDNSAGVATLLGVARAMRAAPPRGVGDMLFAANAGEEGRGDLHQFHAERVGEILHQCGYDEETIARVQALVRKYRLATDPEVQTLEDGLCLVFLETQLHEVGDRIDDEKMVEVLRKTWRKMTPAGREAALRIGLSEHGRGLVERALAGP